MSGHICLLESDPFLAGLFEEGFRSQGWQTRHAEDFDGFEQHLFGEEALCALIDVHVDIDRAFDVLRRLRGGHMDHTSELPVIIFTSAHHPEVVSRFRSLGSRYLIKGHVVPSRVIETVREVVELR